MVGKLSHELRTPLNVILGYSDLLAKSENLSDVEKSHVNNISEGGQELLQIINDIIELNTDRSSIARLRPDKDLKKSPKPSVTKQQGKLSLFKKEDLKAVSKKSSNSPKALIVDDLVMNRTLARIMLETRNFQTIEAENGEEAVQQYIETKPDVVLMDISMPVMNGIEAMRQIRNSSNSEYSSMPIIAITAGGHTGSRSELIEKGFSEYIQKPFREEELINKISMFIPVPEQNMKAVSEA